MSVLPSNHVCVKRKLFGKRRVSALAKTVACGSGVNYLLNAVCRLELKQSLVCRAYELFRRRRVSALAKPSLVCVKRKFSYAVRVRL